MFGELDLHALNCGCLNRGYLLICKFDRKQFSVPVTHTHLLYYHFNLYCVQLQCKICAKKQELIHEELMWIIDACDR